MNNEYVIINKTAIEKIIEENSNDINDYYGHKTLLRQILKHILSKSTPLIPEIKKSYTKGFSEGIVFGMNTEYKYKTSEDYITNLKLDI